MRILIRYLSAALVAAVTSQAIPEAEAGRIGGPTTIVGTVAGGARQSFTKLNLPPGIRR